MYISRHTRNLVISLGLFFTLYLLIKIIQQSFPKPLFICGTNDWKEDSLIEKFSKEFNIKIKWTLIEEISSKNGKICDVVYLRDEKIARLIEDDMLLPISKNLLPQLKYVDPFFLNSYVDPESKYSIPFAWGTTGIGKLKKLQDNQVSSWKILFDPKFKNHLLMMDDQRQTIGVALKYLGFSSNSTDPIELKQAEELLIGQKKFVREYRSDHSVVFKDEVIWYGHLHSNEVLKNKNMVYILPQEGSLIWTYNIAIPKNSRSKKNAISYIGFMLEPIHAAKIFNQIPFATSNLEARKYIDKQVLTNQGLYPSYEFLRKFEFKKSLGNASQLWEILWSKIKS